jgi:CubicO group peptidase (beta-lactamase class C family)
MRRRLIFRLAVALLLCASAAPTRADDVDKYVREQMAKRHIPGVSVAVVRDGKLVKAKGYGLANLELNVPAAPDTVYEIGSLTKQFTATAVMLLVEDGKVNLDDHVAKYLERAPEAWKNITVRHLLTHTSGIFNYVGTPGFELSRHLTGDQFIKAAANLPVLFEAGSSWEYSNTNYTLLGHLVERASGKPFWQFLDERLFRPAGMNQTRYNDFGKVIPARANGYFWRNNEWTNRNPIVADVAAAGALLSSALDMAKWEAALSSGKVLRPASLEQMWTPVRLNNGKTFPYGFGWSVETFRGRRQMSHGGLMGGFSSYMTRFPDDRLTVIVLSNLANLRERPQAGALGIGISAIYIPSLALGALREIPDPEPQTTRKLRDALAALLDGKPEASLFTPPSLEFHTSERGRALHKEIAAHGPLKSLSLLERKEEGEDRLYLYRALVGRDKIYLSFTLTNEGKISSLRVEEE